MPDRPRGTHRGDQASRLRQLVRSEGRAPVNPVESSCHVVTVLSGKGGVGKTLVATNLAIAMAARGHRVILFDMDMGLANADIVLGIEARGTWSDVLKGRSLDDVVVQGPGGIAFVPGASGVAELADLSDFERHQLGAAMQQVERRYDVVILDCGAGISRNVLSFAATADTILVVTTPEPTSFTDAYAMIKAFPQLVAGRRSRNESIGCLGLIVNNAMNRREAHDIFERIAGVAARFLHLPVSDYGYVLHDDHVSAAVRQRTPLILRYPRCPAASCVMALALKLSREIGQPQAKPTLLQRVVNMFF